MKCDHCTSVNYRTSPEKHPMVMHEIGCAALTSIKTGPTVKDHWTEVRDGQTVTVEECERPNGTGFCRVIDEAGGITTWWELDGKSE